MDAAATGDVVMADAPAAAAVATGEDGEEFWERLGKLRRIISGGFGQALHLDFLHRQVRYGLSAEAGLQDG